RETGAHERACWKRSNVAALIDHETYLLCLGSARLTAVNRADDVYGLRYRPKRAAIASIRLSISLRLRQFAGTLLHDGHARQRSRRFASLLLCFSAVVINIPRTCRECSGGFRTWTNSSTVSSPELASTARSPKNQLASSSTSFRGRARPRRCTPCSIGCPAPTPLWLRRVRMTPAACSAEWVA